MPSRIFWPATNSPTNGSTSKRTRRQVSSLEAAGATPTNLPIVIFPDGSHLVQPTLAQVAEKVGLRTQARAPFYDLVIVGGGPAGLAAGVYGASEGLRTLIIEREAPGGQAGQSSRIENYLGFPVGLSGLDLARRAVAQATRFGTEILTPQEVTGVRLNGRYKLLTLADGSEVSCHALLVATGVQYRKLEAPGVEALDRRRHLLRRSDHRGALDQGPGCVRHRRRQLGRPGRDVFIRLRPPGDDPRARLWSGGEHVAVSD